MIIFKLINLRITKKGVHIYQEKILNLNNLNQQINFRFTFELIDLKLKQRSYRNDIGVVFKEECFNMNVCSN